MSIAILDGGSLLILTIIAASFGPYIAPSAGLRTEHLVIYGALPLALIWLPHKNTTVLRFRGTGALVMLMAMATVWTLVSTFADAPLYGSVYSLFAALENYVQPIAIILVAAAFAGSLDSQHAQRLLERSAKLLIGLLVANAALSAYEVFFGAPSFIMAYWQPPVVDGGKSVMLKAFGMGRYLGVFNQPMESGATYALALLAWVYLTRRAGAVRMFDYAVLFTLILGGMLSVSKIFVVGGLLLFPVYWYWEQGLKIFNWRFALSLLIGCLLVVQLTSAWWNLGFLLRLFSPGSDSATSIVELYTAGRFGGESGGTLAQLFSNVWMESPILGWGFASFTPLDSAYAEFFVQGGLVALVIYVMMILSIGLVGIREYGSQPHEARLLIFLFVLIAGAGTGAPVATMNRFSTIFWVILMLLYTIIYARKREAGLAPGR